MILRVPFGVLSLFAALSLSEASVPPPSLVDWSGTPSLFTQGVALPNGTVLLVNRQHALADLVIGTRSNRWSKLSFSESAPGAFSALTAIDDETWLARHGKDLWISSDKGLSWQQPESILPLVLKSDEGALSQLGQLGALKWNRSSGRLLWQGPEDMSEFNFRSISVVSPTAAVAAVSFTGKFGPQTFGLLMTEDAGRHWEWLVKEGSFSFDASGNYLVHHVFFLTLQIGWISSDYLDDVYHTADGGKTWIHSKAPDRIASALYFKNEHDGLIIGGSTARIYETKNGGRDWRELADDEVLSPSFIEYFEGVPERRWNDFAVYRFLLAHR
jgi:photosystem II stability/assembly factor-like uncharacterized protein